MSTPIEKWAKDMKNTIHKRLRNAQCEVKLSLTFYDYAYYLIQSRIVSECFNVHTL